MIPGSNLLKRALRKIHAETVLYYRYIARENNAVGLFVTTYDDPTAIKGSVQAVPRDLYERLGLNFQNNYINFFVSKDLLDIARDVSGDQIAWNGRRWECESLTPWYGIDGWVQVIAIDVGPDPGIPASYTWGFDSDHANFDNGNFNDFTGITIGTWGDGTEGTWADGTKGGWAKENVEGTWGDGTKGAWADGTKGEW